MPVDVEREERVGRRASGRSGAETTVAGARWSVAVALAAQLPLAVPLAYQFLEGAAFRESELAAPGFLPLIAALLAYAGWKVVRLTAPEVDPTWLLLGGLANLAGGAWFLALRPSLWAMAVPPSAVAAHGALAGVAGAWMLAVGLPAAGVGGVDGPIRERVGNLASALDAVPLAVALLAVGLGLLGSPPVADAAGVLLVEARVPLLGLVAVVQARRSLGAGRPRRTGLAVEGTGVALALLALGGLGGACGTWLTALAGSATGGVPPGPTAGCTLPASAPLALVGGALALAGAAVEPVARRRRAG